MGRTARALLPLVLSAVGVSGCGRSGRNSGPTHHATDAGLGGGGGAAGTRSGGAAGQQGGGRPSGGEQGGGESDAGEGGVGQGAGGVAGAGGSGGQGMAGAGTAGSGCQPADSSPKEYFANTQEALEALTGITDVQSLVLTGPISDLGPLSCLERIRDGFELSFAPEVVSLHGLGRLESVGRFYVAETSLSSFDGLDRLASATQIDVFYNDALITAAFPALVTADSVTIQHNVALDSVELPLLAEASSLRLDRNRMRTLDLAALTSVHGDFDLSDNALVSSAGLRSLAIVEGAFDLGRNMLEGVSGLSSLGRVTGELTLEENPLGSLVGLEKLEAVGGLTVRSTALETLEPLAHLRELESLRLEGNPQLATIEGLQGLNQVGTIYIENVPLVNLDGLRGLTSLTSLTIFTTPALTNIDGLSGLTDVEEVVLSDAHALADLDGLGNVTHIDFLQLSLLSMRSLGTLPGLTGVSTAYITSMPNLTELDAFAKLSSPPTSVWLSELPSLTSVRGLSSLRATNGFELHGTAVTDLTGLELLEGGGSTFTIESNPLLTSLRALTSLTGAEFMAVTDNAALPTCEAEWLSARTSHDVFTLSGNDDGGSCP